MDLPIQLPHSLMTLVIETLDADIIIKEAPTAANIADLIRRIVKTASRTSDKNHKEYYNDSSSSSDGFSSSSSSDSDFSDSDHSGQLDSKSRKRRRHRLPQRSTQFIHQCETSGNQLTTESTRTHSGILHPSGYTPTSSEPLENPMFHSPGAGVVQHSESGSKYVASLKLNVQRIKNSSAFATTFSILLSARAL